MIKRFATSRLYPRWPFDFSVEHAMGVHRLVSEALASSKERILGSWDEQLANLAGAVLSERAQARAVDDYRRRQEVESRQR